LDLFHSRFRTASSQICFFVCRLQKDLTQASVQLPSQLLAMVLKERERMDAPTAGHESRVRGQRDQEPVVARSKIDSLARPFIFQEKRWESAVFALCLLKKAETSFRPSISGWRRLCFVAWQQQPGASL
jgi:hypothetical protein